MEKVEEKDKSVVYTNKVFVGNVPFQCTKDEFVKCFDSMEGFVEADIIHRHRSKLSRGFGFVIFDTEDSAKNLLEGEPIILRDRELRFSVYTFDSSKKYNKPYQVFIKDIPSEDVSTWLKTKLQEYELSEDLTSCVPVFKFGKTHCIATFSSSESYKNLLVLAENKTIDLSVSPYKRKTNSVRKLNDPQTAYREGFRAGHAVGFKEGQEAVSDK